MLLQRIKNRLFPAPQLPPPEVIEPSAHEVMVAKWYADGGEDYLRYDYDLDQNSLVIDLGGFKGHWADAIYARYGCHIDVYEPVKQYFDHLSWKYRGNNKIKVFPYGLAAENETLQISMSNERSSVHCISEQSETVLIRNIVHECMDKKWEKVDLIKINIEGSEYDLLDSLIEHGLIAKFKNLQIQFHDFIPDAETRMNAIRDALRLTHTQTYCYDFVWENWVLKG